MANYFNYSSVLFDSVSTNRSSFSSLVSEYNQIRNGTYKRLLRAYYDKYQTENEKTGTSKTDKADTKKAAETSQKLTAVSEAASSLKTTALTLAAKGDKSLFVKKTTATTDEAGVTTTKTDYDYDAIVSTVKKFAKEYNETLDAVGKVESQGLQQRTQWLTQVTAEYQGALEAVGITVDDEKRLSVNEEVLRAADIDSLKELFEGAASYGGKAAVKANQIAATAQAQAVKTASAYNSSGLAYDKTAGSLNTGSLFDSLF